ncbi:MAG: hypothetical protein KF712_12995 [Akkermansiaceae bacterium]|nr:hypothetical protein [Akkermansiaceae bacterium]
MSNNRGIFENLPGKPSASPFSVVQDPAAPAPAAGNSPFAAAPRQGSPFSVADDGSAAKGVKIPERRRNDSPFQVSDDNEGFGFEPAPSPFAAAPFEAAPQASPFAAAPSEPAPSPFSAAPEPAASPFAIAPAEPVARPAAAPSPFSAEPSPAPASWQQAPAAASAFGSFSPAPAPAAVAAPPAPAPAPIPVQAPAPAPAAAAPAPAPVSSESDSFAIRQLELRAIFGVDREMSTDEILQRARSLPGIRHIARVSAGDVAAVDALKQVVSNLGFGSGGLKLYAGSVPIEFIRESGVLLAVQTDGGFAPGVRETLMIVARELSRS